METAEVLVESLRAEAKHPVAAFSGEASIGTHLLVEAADTIERLRKIAGAICPNCDHALCCAQCGAQVPNDL